MVLGGLFFFNDTATTEIYTLSLHDALPICERHGLGDAPVVVCVSRLVPRKGQDVLVAGWPRVLARHPDARLLLVDRKSTRLNSSHANISYAVFCLKKKENGKKSRNTRLLQD